MSSSTKTPQETVKMIAVLYSKGCLFTFAALIVGFLGFAVFKSVIQPRLTAGAACDRDAGCLMALLNGRDSVRVLGYSADGKTIITRGGDTLIHDAESGEVSAELNPDFESSFQTIIAGDGSLIATLDSRNNELEFFTPDGEYIDGWVWPESRDIQDFVFLPLVDGFALSGQDGITMWRMVDGTQFTTLPGSEGAGLMVTSADGATLVAFDRDEDAIYVWPLEQIGDGIVIQEAGLFDGFTRQDSLQISADGSLVAAFNKESAFVWNSADGSLHFSTSLASEGIDIVTMGLASNGERLAVGYDDGVVEVWSLIDGQPVGLFEHGQSLNGIALSPTGDRLAVGQLGDSVVTILEPGERFASQSRARRGGANAGIEQYLTPGRVYIDTIPGHALVWEIAP